LAELFSRDEALHGLPAPRAQAMLYLIEGISSRLATGFWPRELANDLAQRHREEAYLDAFALDGHTGDPPTIEQLDRYSEYWWPLLPSDPRVLAALAYQLVQKYQFRSSDGPAIVARLRLRDSAVRDAYQELFGARLDDIFVHEGVASRLRSVLGRRPKL